MENANERGPLSFEDAQKEAEMMLTLLEQAGIEESPSAEDYQAVSDAIDDIITAAENETDVDRAKLAIGRVVQGLGVVPLAILTVSESFLTQFSNQDTRGGLDVPELMTDDLWEFNQRLSERLKGSRGKLRELEKAAERRAA